MKRKSAGLIILLFLVGMGLNAPAAMADHNERSTKERALIIGGSTAAGAALGALIGGKKGAVAGAIAGGAGSAVYDQAERTKGHERSTTDKLIVIGGSSGTGAAVGAVAGGAKGAIIGAAIGAAGGYVLHETTDRDGSDYRSGYRYRNAYRYRESRGRR